MFRQNASVCMYNILVYIYAYQYLYIYIYTCGYKCMLCIHIMYVYIYIYIYYLMIYTPVCRSTHSYIYIYTYIQLYNYKKKMCISHTLYMLHVYRLLHMFKYISYSIPYFTELIPFSAPPEQPVTLKTMPVKQRTETRTKVIWKLLSVYLWESGNGNQKSSHATDHLSGMIPPTFIQGWPSFLTEIAWDDHGDPKKKTSKATMLLDIKECWARNPFATGFVRHPSEKCLKRSAHWHHLKEPKKPNQCPGNPRFDPGFSKLFAGNVTNVTDTFARMLRDL